MCCCIHLTESIMKINEFPTDIHEFLEAGVINVIKQQHLVTLYGTQAQLWMNSILFVVWKR